MYEATLNRLGRVLPLQLVELCGFSLVSFRTAAWHIALCEQATCQLVTV